MIGLGSTVHYGDNLICFLFPKGFKIGLINPIQTDSLRSSNIRKTKLAKFFKGNLHIKTSYTLLSKYSSPKQISFVRIDTLTNLLTSASKGHYSYYEAVKLKNLAKESIGIDNPALEIQVQCIINQLSLLNSKLVVLNL